jgi:hypothetical protein
MMARSDGAFVAGNRVLRKCVHQDGNLPAFMRSLKKYLSWTIEASSIEVEIVAVREGCQVMIAFLLFREFKLYLLFHFVDQTND